MTGSASDELRRIADALRAAGDGAAMRRVAAAIRQQARPLVEDVKVAAAEQLPHRGGLAERVASERVTVSVQTGARTAGVRLRTRTRDSRATDSGYVRHPVFGRDQWVRQEIPRARGWWTDTLKRRSDRVTRSVVQAMRDVAHDVQRGVSP